MRVRVGKVCGGDGRVLRPTAKRGCQLTRGLCSGRRGEITHYAPVLVSSD